MTLLEFMMRPELVSQSWDYYRNVQTKNKKYTSLLRTGDQPAIHLNKGIMDRYRPEMRKFYFDPGTHKTYLDQLGIKYPTVRTGSTNQQ
jgi:aminobenzoyl-glutamate utilization protein B